MADQSLYLKNLWYLACHGSFLKQDKLMGKEMLGEKIATRFQEAMKIAKHHLQSGAVHVKEHPGAGDEADGAGDLIREVVIRRGVNHAERSKGGGQGLSG